MSDILLVTSQGRAAASLPKRAHAVDRGLAPSDAALSDMTRFGVRALLATRHCPAHRDCDIAGLVTSCDIQGERPLQFLQASTRRHHCDICVGDIMTPWEELSLLDYDSLGSISVADVFELLRGAGLTHLLVVEANSNGPALVRGLVSRSELERRLRGAETLARVE